MMINRTFFFDYARAHIFRGAISQSQRDGLTAILDKWQLVSPNADDRWLAYMLGTAHHETGARMQPVRETFAASDQQAAARLETAWRKGQLPWVTTPYWRPDANGQYWYGRGLVQITHKANYRKLGTLIGVNLTGNPSLALDSQVALAIMFDGMRAGSFTGKTLANYFSPTKGDWINARRIINGIESAQLVAAYAQSYYAAISYTT